LRVVPRAAAVVVTRVSNGRLHCELPAVIAFGLLDGCDDSVLSSLAYDD